MDFQILANNVDITKKIKSLGSYSISVTDAIGDQADGFSIRISDADNEIVFPQNSTKLEVFLGYKDNLRSFGFFYITNTKYTFTYGQGSFIDIVASSVPFTETLTYKSMQNSQERTFSNTTVTAVVKQIASEHDLETEINESIGNQVIENISQHGESNIGFLYRLVRAYGGVLKPTSNKLLVLSNEKGLNVRGETLDTISIDQKETDNINYSCDKTAKFKSVQANYQDTDSATIKIVTVGDGEPVQKLSYMYDSELAAMNAAKKIYSSANLNNDTLSFTTVGNPDLIAGVPIKVEGLREDIPQSWYIKTAVHTITKAGYSTSLDLTIRTDETVETSIKNATANVTQGNSSANNNAQNNNSGGGNIIANLSLSDIETLNNVIGIINDWGDDLKEFLANPPEF